MADESSSFFLLDERIQRFIWAEGWQELRDAQEKAIPFIVNADQDVIVAAATAAGKTEAAFFPALTYLLKANSEGLIVYISPLKALINDQFGRLQRLCESLEIPVWPWHGDIAASRKTRFFSKPQGVLLITPESLEAMLCNRGSSAASVFRHAAFFVVDELHAFIGSERGKQLQSLMHRVDAAVNRLVPRVGLSATLGDMSLAADFLRPGNAQKVEVVKSDYSEVELRVLVKGYEEPLVVRDGEEEVEAELISPAQVGLHLFNNLRGSNNLIFPNSRREVERYTFLLNGFCERMQVPNEFWPHHGSLSKEIRAETEAALKQKEVPASAICTNTLELGIDIGAVKSVAQIGAAPSIASLRQRLGRSGRRKGEPAILRGYCVEDAIGVNSPFDTELRLGTLQMTAQITLLLEKWFEPPQSNGAHLSTLIQQILSSIAQTGGGTAAQIYGLLCGKGNPFPNLSKVEFLELLKHLGREEFLQQDSSGVLLHGRVGEKFVNHYTFYAAFAADEEFRIVTNGRTLGSVPVTQMLTTGQHILFAGKTWRVDEVDEQQKTIYVTRTSGGVPPPFSSGGGRTHTRVRQRMREILEERSSPAFLDGTAQRFLAEARRYYQRSDLANQIVLDQGAEVALLTWLGDSANEAIACLLIRRGFKARSSGPGLVVSKGTRSTQDVIDALMDAAVDEPPPIDVLLEDVRNLQREKWDWALPPSLLRKAYASHYLDLSEALAWTRSLAP